MHFLADYGLFLIKAVTIVVAILIVVAGIVALAGKNKGKQTGKLKIKKLNKRFQEITDEVNQTTLSKSEFRKLHKASKKNSKHAAKQKKPRLFVLNFHGDIKASAVNNLREEINAMLLTAKPNDECLVLLESGGGIVNAYGLAASQLARIKAANIKLTIAVDKIAASGGYMMACVADQIIAAPFAIIGSIGVIAQLPNFHRFLEKKAIDFEMHTAGQFKRTLTMFGENTKEGRNKLQQEIEETHDLFKTFITMHRNKLDINKVATGEHWFGTRALELELIDHIQTSDDFIIQAKNNFDIYQLQYKMKKSLGKRLSHGATNAFANFIRPLNIGGQDYLA